MLVASIATITATITPHLMNRTVAGDEPPVTTTNFVNVYLSAYHYEYNIWEMDFPDALFWNDQIVIFPLGNGKVEIIKPCREPINQNAIGTQFRLVNYPYLYILELRWGFLTKH